MDDINKLNKKIVREELKLKVLLTIYTFKSKEVPDYGDLTDEDIINVLSSIIARRTEI